MDDIVFWLLIGIGIIAGLLALVFLAGFFLPRSHQVARSIDLKPSADAVWQTITDYEKVPSWHPNVRQVAKHPDRNGHECWKETYDDGYALFLETVESTPPTRLVRSIADDNGPFTGRWEFGLTPMETGCTVTITEHGAIANPFFRLMYRLFMKPEAYIEMYLTALARHFGEAATLR